MNNGYIPPTFGFDWFEKTFPHGANNTYNPSDMAWAYEQGRIDRITDEVEKSNQGVDMQMRPQ